MRKTLLTVLAITMLALLAGCGNDWHYAPPPSGPTGGNNAGFGMPSLSGRYTLATTGVNVIGNSYYLFDVVGSFTADGAGNISSGYRDLYTDSGTQVQKEAFTGSYTVGQDGRGQMQLTLADNSTITYRFIMQSSGAASFFQYSPSADDTGRILAQSSISAPTGSYVVRLDGEDASLYPFGAVGLLNISGTTISGLIDQNDDGNVSTLLSTTGSITAPDSSGRGTLSLTNSAGTHNFVYWVTSTGHLQLASTDANFWLHGYADLQTGVSGSTAGFTGSQVYSVGGVASAGPTTETGRFTLDGAGNITSGVEDNNVNFTLNPSVTVTGTYVAAATGRWTATTTGLAANLIGWQVSPTQSVLLASNGTSTLLETGTLRAQTTGLTNANISGNYAEDLSGYNIAYPGNVEITANYLADGSGNLTGTMDSQTPGYYNTDIAETGTYSMQSNGRNTGTVAGVPMVLYSVDSTTMYLMPADPARQYQGKLVKQTP